MVGWCGSRDWGGGEQEGCQYGARFVCFKLKDRVNTFNANGAKSNA